jgi:hypothetical protein
VGALTTVAGDDTRSAELFGADEDAGVEVDARVVIDADSDECPAEDEDGDGDSDAVTDAPERSAVDPLD